MKRLLVNKLFKNYISEFRKRLLQKDINIIDIFKMFLILKRQKKECD